jgi:hypothetical protein
MNNIDIIRLTSGLLQLGVAFYALRLGRLFKSTLLGWLFFGALSLAALASLFLAVKPLDAGDQWGIKVDIFYVFLLLVGVVRFYPGLKTFLQEEAAKRQALDKWELQVKEQWMELIKTNEKLRQTVNQRETEIAERKQAQEQLEKNLQELQAASRQNEQTLPPAMPGQDTEVIEQQPATTPELAEKNGGPEKNGEHPLTAPHTNGDEPLPVVAGFDTAIITHEPAPQPAEKNGGPEKNGNGEPETNGEHLLTTPRHNGEELQPIALAPTRNTRKTAARKSSRPSRKKRALAR